MVQVYLLLVVLNVLSGLVLARQGLKNPLAWDGLFAVFDTPLVRGLLGLGTFLSGFLALLFVLPGDQLFLGDLLPAVSALLAGTVLVLDFYRKAPEAAQGEGEVAEPAPVSVPDDLLAKNRVLVGLLALTLGLVHFLVPGVLFL